MSPREMFVKDLGEFQLIDLLASTQGADHAPKSNSQLMLSIGDDAAAWRGSDSTTVLTTDTMVEGVHFSLDWTGWEALGWKAMATNQSDVAAMGCMPMYAVVSLGLRGDLPVEGLEQMYRGMAAACAANGGAVVGGDVVRSPTFFVTVAMTGSVEGEGRLLTRDAAKPGDIIAVTGNLGSSAGGLQTLKDGLVIDGEIAAHLRNAHIRPSPRVAEGRALRGLGVSAAIDISDGLVDDLGKFCAASGVGADLRADQVPVDDRLKSAFPDDWLSLALSGGEDYELAFTAPAETVAEAKRMLDATVTAIGQVREGSGVRVLKDDGDEISVGRGGWDHFG
jgi:thiamine-monophosphate kinase